MKSITVEKLLGNNKNYQQVTGNEESLKRVILTGEINRPGFELAGFFKHSDFRRIIVFGDKEMAFIAEMTEERQKEIFPCLINEEVPCIVICKGHACPEVLKNIADEKDIIFSLERVGLDPDSDKKVKKFSLGMKQRLNIAQAIFENQKIILLDEPTNALDEDAVQLIYKIIREEKSRGATIIVATHHKEDLKEVCDVILKIAEGKIVEENENK